MNTALCLRDHAPKDELQRAFDAIEGYMFFGLKQEALSVRWELGDTYYEDPRMQKAPAAVLEVEDWIVRFSEAFGQSRASGEHAARCVAIAAELNPPEVRARLREHSEASTP